MVADGGDCMEFNYNDKTYDIIVLKKRTTKNLYVKVKEDLKIYIYRRIKLYRYSDLSPL